MKSFTHKWRDCARRAAGHPALPETPPPGFAARVLARHQASPSLSLGWETLWLRFSLPALTASALLLVIGTLLYWQSLGPGEGALRPPLENAIIEQIQLL